MNNKRCSYCKSLCIKKGKRYLVQRYQCLDSGCRKYQQSSYVREDKKIDLEFLKQLHSEGLGVSGIARILKISKSTVQRKIEKLSEETTLPYIQESGQQYEVDELRTYVGHKKNESWVMYAINRRTKRKLALLVGRRTKSNLKKIIDYLLTLNPKKIITDHLNIYPSLIPKRLHVQSDNILSFIERSNLNLRTHLKRLSRKTICYSKSERMLYHSVKLYFSA